MADPITGTSGPDILNGTADGELIQGLGGTDTISGNGGGDTILGGGGDDQVDGGEGNDLIFGSGGADDLVGGAGDDTMSGGAGNDELAGGEGEDAAVYDGNFADYAITVGNDGQPFVQVVAPVGTGEGTDKHRAGTEVLQFGDASVRVVSAGGTYTSIQDAIDAANPGDVILVAAGTYTENIVIDRQVTLLSLDGAGTTNIVGSPPGLGTVVVAPGVNGVVIGDTGQGFTITGFDGIPASEAAAVYLQGAHNGFTLRGNNVVADGDAGLLTEFGSLATGFVIDGNEFSGQTFTGGGPGSGNQFVEPNVARPLVFIGTNGNTALADGVQFTNNQITGTTGGIATSGPSTGLPVGNVMVNIDGSDAVVTANTWTGSSAGGNAFGLRIRADGATVDGNTFDNTGGGNSLGFTSNGNPGTFTGNDFIGDPVVAEDDTFVGTPGADTMDGGAGNDVLVGAGGADDMQGGAGDDQFVIANGTDFAPGETIDGGDGTDEVASFVTFDLAATTDVENLELRETIASSSIDFEGFGTGPITDGEQGWKSTLPSRDQEVVADPDDALNQVWRISNDPASGDFAGPYTPGLSVDAGESVTGAAVDSMAVSYRFKAVSDDADGSRLEVDFGTTARDDRNNFLVIEHTGVPGTGLRVAVSDPLTTPDTWTNDSGAPFNFDFATGNVTLAAELDPEAWHEISMVVRFEDGPNNDVIQVFVDGQFVGESTTFENYRDNHLGLDHDTEANAVDNVFFRVAEQPGNSFPQDGAGGERAGFFIDDIGYETFDSGTEGPDGFGNDLGNTITGTSAQNAIDGRAGDDDLSGGHGDDTLTGGTGNDDLDGGSGRDTATFAGDYEDHTIALSGTGFSVTDDEAGDGDDGTDTIANAETLEFAGATVHLVGNGGYATIQDAIEAATAGDTILVAEGTYAENVVVNKSVTIEGLGNVVIEGTFHETNGNFAGTVAKHLESALSYSNVSGTALTIAADGVTLRNIVVNDFYKAIELGSNDGLTLENVDVSNTVHGISKSTAAEVTNFSMTGGTVSGTYIGMNIAAATNAGKFDGVLIDGVTFEHMGEKGIYVEQLSNATLTGITMNDVGQFGRGPAFGAPQTGWWGAGIDINLKHGAYSNVTIDDFTFTDVGLSAGGTMTPGATGGAILIKARDDAPSYHMPPASLTGITVSNGTIDGTSTGIRVGEPGKTNAGPEVTVTDVEITDALLGDVDNRSQTALNIQVSDGDPDVLANESATGVINITGTDDANHIRGGGAGDTLLGNGAADEVEGGGGGDDIDGGTGDDTLDGGTGGDELTGGVGDDDIEGGTGADTAVFAGDRADYTVTINGATGVTVLDDAPLAADDEGSDGLSGVGRLEFASGGNVLIVGGDDFPTLQSAVDAAVSGDTIYVLEGSYIGPTTVGVANLTILGPKEGIAGIDGARGTGEAVLNGGIIITADGVTLDGLTVNDATAATSHIGVWLLANDATVQNLVVQQTGTPGSPLTIGISNSPTFGQGSVIQNNLSTGWEDGAYITRDADGIQVLNNQFSGNGAGMVFEGGQDDAVVSGNSFLDNLGSGLAIGFDGTSADAATDISGNTFEGNGRSISNFDPGLPDAGAGAVGTDVVEGNTIQGSAGNDVLNDDATGDGRIPGHVGGNTILGLAGDDTLTGGAGDDTLDGGDDDDLLEGGAENDTLTGGSGEDELVGGAGDDRLTGGADQDILRGGSGGNDTYVLAAGDLDGFGGILDAIIDLGGGIDTVEAAGTVSIAGLPQIENLVLVAGAGAIDGTGNSVANSIAGNESANTLQGLGGNDLLDGGAGDDDMRGGSGDDVYIVDDIGDTADETGGNGVDEVRSSVTFTLGAGLENLTLTGTADLDGTGNDAANVITGNAGDNTLEGLGGNDLLDGGAGADIMRGGAGDDVYVVDDVGDTADETGGEGVDEVQSSVTVTLGAGLENLTLTSAADLAGTGNGAANVITGNTGDNTLEGRGGNDTLDGGAGADVMVGGHGDDIYIVDHSGDTVSEAGGSGIDTVRSSVTLALTGGVEHLELTGDAAINGDGNGLANQITGNAAANRLDGKGGDDTLAGGLGKDILIGGSGADRFDFNDVAESEVGNTGRDAITAFSQAQGDSIDLEDIDADTEAAGDQAFAFIGADAFSGEEAGELRSFGFGSHTLIQGDVDGDGVADFEIILTLTPASLDASDFVL